MEIGDVVILKDGRKGLIESGSYYGSYNRVSNFWSGKIINEEGELTRVSFSGYDNGAYWTKYKGKYKVIKIVKFK